MYRKTLIALGCVMISLPAFAQSPGSYGSNRNQQNPGSQGYNLRPPRLDVERRNWNDPERYTQNSPKLRRPYVDVNRPPWMPGSALPYPQRQPSELGKAVGKAEEKLKETDKKTGHPTWKKGQKGENDFGWEHNIPPPRSRR